MELVMHLLQVALGALSVLTHGSLESFTSSFSFGGSWISFGVEKCDPCPGSMYTLTGAAWANIGYMTHSDLLYYVAFSRFGLWAPLLYACAAIGALVAVAIGVPPRTYLWFMLGPAIYSFLINTTQEVRGVDWVVAGQQQDMAEVWRDAETGMKNTGLVQRLGMQVNKVNGPQSNYPVATAMLFLDEVFSTTTNLLIGWLGISNQKGEGGNDTNLAKPTNEKEGPWYLLSTLKWPMVENITAGTFRNPDLRDAFVSFLSSECGEKFKQGVNSGEYIAASQSKGWSLPSTVFIKEAGGASSGSTGGGSDEFKGDDLQQQDYKAFVHGMDVVSIPSPRSIARLYNDVHNDGSFGKFAPLFGTGGGSGSDPMPIEAGRGSLIVCSEYLYTLIQGLRWEAGHSYWQLLRSSPQGLERQDMLNGLFYGWDIRKTKDAQYANKDEMEAFTKHLILIYMLRNELQFAPQITSIDQRYSPSEQSRSYSEAYVRTSGSKSKWGELYNWAILMPHIQGVLAYLLIVAYPFATMVMVLPGYWKAFFTWVAFFAWVKLWDVGFAMVQVLERSVWAMMGNKSAMARVANMIIQTAEKAGGIGVGCSDGGNFVGPPTPNGQTSASLPSLCAVPLVCSRTGLNGECNDGGQDQEPNKAWFLLDKALLLSSAADLDVVNGYYVYIMAALYFAVPAVTGQLVLGAKAGASGMVSNMIGGAAGEAGRAAMTGYQHGATNQALSASTAVGQMAYAKGMRQNGLAAQYLDAANRGLEMEATGGLLGAKQRSLRTGADMKDAAAKDMELTADGISKVIQAGAGPFKGGWSTKAGEGTGTPADFAKGLAGMGGFAALQLPVIMAKKNANAAGAFAAIRGSDMAWDADRLSAQRSGIGAMAGRLERQANYDADMESWQARTALASHAAANAGIAGMNSGSLTPNHKPTDMTGMIMDGMGGGGLSSAANYAGSGFVRQVGTTFGAGKVRGGSAWNAFNWGGGTSAQGMWNNTTEFLKQAVSDSDALGNAAASVLTNGSNSTYGNNHSEWAHRPIK